MRSRLTVTLGHAARLAARLRGGGSGGTAFPGLVMERTDPGFLERTLGRLPRGVIVVSGTNGKTTTTKMVVQLLREQGMKVFTNRTGSNFVRGVLASLLHSIAKATSDVVVLNGDDPRLAAPAFLEGVSARVVSFGAGEDLRSLFLSDDDLRTGLVSPRQAGQAPGPRVTLEAIDGQRATVRVDGVSHEVDFAIPGVHNLLNACAALGVVLEVLGEDADLPGLLTTLGNVRAAFGRGEVLTLDGRPVQLSLVKNPAGFRMGLLSAASQAQDGEVVVVAINDEYADGRDMSWLWDVDFSALRAGGVTVVTGVRAWDMALRLRYDEVEVAEVEPDLRRAVALMRRVAADTDRPMRVFTTYTAMLALRSILGEMTDVEEVMS